MRNREPFINDTELLQCPPKGELLYLLFSSTFLVCFRQIIQRREELLILKRAINCKKNTFQPT